jgi:sulfatase maturation enzyme AslB (radical SAM superfamily)
MCGGGVLLNRYSADGDFDNPSILCNDLQQFYSTVAAYLARSGISRGRLARSLA